MNWAIMIIQKTGRSGFFFDTQNAARLAALLELEVTRRKTARRRRSRPLVGSWQRRNFSGGRAGCPVPASVLITAKSGPERKGGPHHHD